MTQAGITVRLRMEKMTEYSLARTCSGSGWAWILPRSDGVSTVPDEIENVEDRHTDSF